MVAVSLPSADPYVGYCYSYPHKTCYRPLSPVSLEDVWAEENKQSLFLYFHIPFCAARCGYCNLFSLQRPDEEIVDSFFGGLQRQVDAVRDSLPGLSVARMAIGGGTPTFLSTKKLQRVFRMAESFGSDLKMIAPSVELSPDTISFEKIELLKRNHVHRVSIGVQSFSPKERQTLHRKCSQKELLAALSTLAEANFSVFNVDLIYGIPGQNVQSFLESLRQIIYFGANELYLYPLYIRELTALKKHGAVVGDNRLELYRKGREFLIEHGYRQISLRHFSKMACQATLPEYSCQNDGMIGLGCGARSYTSTLHYSFEYAIANESTRSLIQNYSKTDFHMVDYGIHLDLEEQQRRYVVKSLLHSTGLNFTDYNQRFESSVEADFPFLKNLLDSRLASQKDGHLKLTAFGMERSDAIGPWLYSSKVKTLMEEFAWK